VQSGLNIAANSPLEELQQERHCAWCLLIGRTIARVAVLIRQRRFFRSMALPMKWQWRFARALLRDQQKS